MSKNKLFSTILVVIIYLISTGTSYIFFSVNAASSVKTTLPTVGTSDKLTFDETLPRTEPCPMNGTLYSKQQKDWWEKHRPLGIMVENHAEARPQSGLSSADVLYEAVAEGGITRFLSIFYCQSAEEVGPIRSARTYFLDFISEYGVSPLYAHVGGANQDGPADALSQIEDYGWAGVNDMNQFSIGFPTFWRDYDRLGHPAATEHTMYSTTEKLLQFAATSRKLTAEDENGITWTKGFVPYSFKEDAPVSQRPPKQTIHLEFWAEDPAYAVDWIYEPIANIYKRNNREVAQIDRNNSQQLTAKNIVVLYMFQTNANDGYQDNQHLLYKTKGVGRANIFMDGKQITGTWRKDSRTARTLLFDNTGLPIKFDRGTIWFEILPIGGILTVK
ncbi:MAG: hypothetical protein A3B47_01350 [Candidatus Levybacteria bacterium RIFCSPLOWO2_01_FULL_39_24]|nr:MAG: hypothetical protein A2800_03385 [Candidatus Levybacteria bacterium RIFCSPHIGHO2_01_FULL_40_16]OGH28633.1 MAG: hypothetical protein A3E12_03285 [Candidatus Levybacteria bacterium RIFCSPHIGHO2_12_FULL_39_9]OGH46022.1 MAG: hypothetical protein A3B47_01350 [Candidatus Levybacteria bacterium RIFCSPLOWO2_01_FULL_39_24]